MEWEGPPKQGLYDPQNEHEACGVGFVVAIDGKRSHKVSVLIYLRLSGSGPFNFYSITLFLNPFVMSPLSGNLNNQYFVVLQFLKACQSYDKTYHASTITVFRKSYVSSYCFPQ